MSQHSTVAATKCALAVASLKNLLGLFNERHLDLICDQYWLTSTERITVSKGLFIV